ncbi:MAG: hypothetical protein ACIALR_08900, partial [Blastopirellula sp. JB062]
YDAAKRNVSHASIASLLHIASRWNMMFLCFFACALQPRKRPPNQAKQRRYPSSIPYRRNAAVMT